MDVKEMMKKHELWLARKPLSEFIDFSNKDLSGENFQDGFLFSATMHNTILSDANLQNTTIKMAYLDNVNAARANFSGANLELSCLRNSNFRGANFTNADLGGADLRNANFSGTIGLVDPINFLEENFEVSSLGYIVYKVFNYKFDSPQYWSIEPNSVISEVANFNRCDSCGCGINVAPLKWIRENAPSDSAVWKCLIEWPWLAGVCVPYNTDGQIRVSRVRLLEVVPQSKEC